MAGYSFAPSQVGGFGGGYLSTGIGAAMGNAANAGLRLANGFREYQNMNMLDQYQIPAAEAGYDAARLQGANNALTGQYTNAGLQNMAQQPAVPNVAPVGDDAQTFYSAATGDVGRNGMMAIGGDMSLGNPYPQNYYGSDVFQTALTGDTSQRNALNYHPTQSLNATTPQGIPNNYLRY